MVTDHPGPDELVDYQEGRLAEAEAERVQRHLAACSKCAGEVLGLEAFDEPEDTELRPSGAETAQDWARFRNARRDGTRP